MARKSFATIEDLQAYWRVLNVDEQNRAKMLLELASDRLRILAQRAQIDLDTKIEDDPKSAYANMLKFVVMDAVKRAMQATPDLPPVNSYQQAAGPYSENITYANPTGDLYFKKSELNTLGISGGQQLDSLSSALNNQNLYGGN